MGAFPSSAASLALFVIKVSDEVRRPCGKEPSFWDDPVCALTHLLHPFLLVACARAATVIGRPAAGVLVALSAYHWMSRAACRGTARLIKGSAAIPKPCKWLMIGGHHLSVSLAYDVGSLVDRPTFWVASWLGHTIDEAVSDRMLGLDDGPKKVCMLAYEVSWFATVASVLLDGGTPLLEEVPFLLLMAYRNAILPFFLFSIGRRQVAKIKVVEAALIAACLARRASS